MLYTKEEVSVVLLGIDLKARLRNKAFWIAMASAVALLAQQLGLNIFPSNYEEIVNSVLTLLAMIGIVVDTSTVGISDKIVNNTTDIIQSSNSTEDESREVNK